MGAVNVSERLASFVAEAKSVPEEAIVQAKRALLDTLGVGPGRLRGGERPRRGVSGLTETLRAASTDAQR